MTESSPITPPPELMEAWRAAAGNVPASLSTDPGGRRDYIDYIATQAARWGSDQELLACGNYLKHYAQWEPEDVTEFYNYRRPKPPSLKERALKALDDISIASFEQDAASTIREALEALPE